MVVGICEISLNAPWVSDLKEKRMVLKSIIQKSKNKFNISIGEVDRQDNHNIMVIGFACVTNDASHANSIIDNVVNYIENNTEADIFDISKEIL